MVNFTNLRKRMIKDLRNRDITDKKVLNSMSKVPRENFILKEFKSHAYDDSALPLLEDQTISQPYTVAFMLQVLELKQGLDVLEVGTGSGYNAALISEIVKPGKVFTFEINKKVYDFGKSNLKNYKNVKVIHGNGSKGVKNRKFDRIIITAACHEIPKNLIKQLRDPGVLVLPVGYPVQTMVKIIKKKGKIETENWGSFVFVPLR